MTLHPTLARFQGKLIASAQAYPGEPVRDPRTMQQVAEACAAGGVAAIRAQSLADLALIHEHVDLPLIVEGRVHTPEQAVAAMRAGAFAVVVGTAITHPTTITSWFADAVEGA